MAVERSAELSSVQIHPNYIITLTHGSVSPLSEQTMCNQYYRTYLKDDGCHVVLELFQRNQENVYTTFGSSHQKRSHCVYYGQLWHLNTWENS